MLEDRLHPASAPPKPTAVPSPWVVRWLAHAPRSEGATLLDVACGGGRHLRHARSLGWQVCGLDRDLSGVGDLAGTPGVELVAADLENGATFPVNQRRFAAVVVTNYLWRPLLPDIVAAVAADGLLIYETFAIGNERYGKPARADFLLQPAELLDAVAARLVPFGYEHIRRDDPPRLIQRLCAVGRSHPWLTDPPPA